MENPFDCAPFYTIGPLPATSISAFAADGHL